MIPERVYERVMEHADRMLDTCLISRYSVGSHGYAQVGWQEHGQRGMTLCHLVVWRHQHGEVPEGWTVDHRTCHQRLCIEVSHLRLLSNFENARRTNGRDWPLGECAQGHPNSDLYWTGSRWRCRPCNTEAQAKYRAKLREL
jgi:hypothetical protein